ncbi:MAG: RHS repeat protein, partial [Lachnospiraceae bacterium]|nr:RHS repeat protein [Lachnospiraceae bacterium]
MGFLSNRWKKQTKIKWISDTETVVTQYDYDRYGRITEVTDSCGNVESYSYDEEGNSHNP